MTGKPSYIKLEKMVKKLELELMEFKNTALETIREKKKKYRTLFENASDAIFIADTKNSRILDVNKQAEKLLKRPAREIIGMHQPDIHPPGKAEYYKNKFKSHVERGYVFDMEAEVIDKDRNIIPVIICAITFHLDGKDLIQGIFKDISKDKMILDLKKELSFRKLVEKAKGILMDRHQISEKEAIKRLQKESRRQRKKVEEIAQAVITCESVLD